MAASWEPMPPRLSSHHRVEWRFARRHSDACHGQRRDHLMTRLATFITYHRRPVRSEQRLDRCDSYQILHGIGELPVERDQSVGLELGQSDVLSVKRVRPPELVGDLPCDDLKLVVFEQPDPHPARVEEAPLGILLGHLTAVYCPG